MAEVEEEHIDEMIHAGVDVFVVGNDARQAHEYLMDALEEGRLTEASLNDRVRRILMAKYWMYRDQPVHDESQEIKTLRASFSEIGVAEKGGEILDEAELWGHFADKKWDILQWILYERSLVLVNHQDDLIPFKELLKNDFHILQYGHRHMRIFKKYADKYADFTSKISANTNGRNIYRL